MSLLQLPGLSSLQVRKCLTLPENLGVMNRPSVQAGRRPGSLPLWVILALSSPLGCNLILGNEQPGAYLADTLASGGAMTGGTSGSGGAPSSGGSPGAGGAPEPSVVGVIGGRCAPHGAYACAGRNQRVQLTCVEGQWDTLGQCEETARCDTREGPHTGVCASVVAECKDKEPGEATELCQGNAPQVCGADRVTVESAAECASSTGCIAGVCQPKISECSGKEEDTWVCAASGAERIQCGTNETESDRQVCARSCTDGWCDAPSCTDLPATCGPTAVGDCCESLFIPSGEFLRGTDDTAPATVTGFRLDKYEVTVGRFRAFKASWEAGYRPMEGSGKHAHLNLGRGLSDGAGGYELGWDVAFEAQVNVTDAAREGSYTNWTAEPGDNENLPINFVNWFEGAAFCIWDGGFLPSEAEWEYAAAGGSEERTYPWGEAAPDCTYANFVLDGGSCSGNPTHSNAVGSLAPGEGRWKQSDLAGNVREWCLDWDAPLITECVDCVQQSAGTLRSCRGGANAYDQTQLPAAERVAIAPTTRAATTGLRCARTP